MFVIILLIFMNNYFIDAFDESSENRYIDRLPRKEKKEFLERVARRILEEVKSGEAAEGVASGEIADELLNVQNNYVSKLLKEETEALKRRNRENNQTKTNAKNNTTKDATQSNDDHDEEKKEEIEKTTENVQGIEKEVTVQRELIMDANDKQVKKDGQGNEHGLKNDEGTALNLTLRQSDLDKSQGIKEVQGMRNNREQDKVQDLETEKADTDEKSKFIDFTVRKDNAQDLINTQIEEKQDPDTNSNHEIIDLTLREGKIDNNPIADTITDRTTESTTTYKTNGPVKNVTVYNIKKDPVSIEITFLNDEEYNEKLTKTSVDKNHEIPVKVVYDEKTVDVSSNSETQKPFLKEVTRNKINNNTKPLHTADTKLEDIDTQELDKKKFRRSLSESLDDIQQVDHTFDNKVARKKRKSKSDTESTEVKEENSTKREKEIHNLKLVQETEKVTINDKNTRLNSKILDQPNINNDLTSISNATSETKSENANTSNTNVKTQESTTRISEIQHTVIDDFDVDENETTSDLIIAKNNTGITTEEIVKMRTQYVTGWEDDSVESMVPTTKPLTGIITEHTTNYPENNKLNITLTSTNNLEPQINVSFYAHKLSDEGDTESIKVQDAFEEAVNASSKHQNDLNKMTNVSLNTVNELGKVDGSNLEQPKSKEVLTSSADSNKELKVSKSNTTESETDKFVKEVDKNKMQAHLPPRVQLSIPKDPVIDYITTVTVEPLTTPKTELQKQLYYAMEAPVEIQNDSVVVLNDSGTKSNLSQNKFTDESNDIPKKFLRQGLRPDDDVEQPYYEIRRKPKTTTATLLKIQPVKKEYLVYELLPGQQPFVKSEPKIKFNPKSHKKLSKNVPKRGEVKKPSLYLESQQPSQIEQPSFAPVHNFAPENAYYNPKNKYGANSDDEEAIIIDERSKERDLVDFEKIFDYEIPKEISWNFNHKERKNGRQIHVTRSDRPILLHLKMSDEENDKQAQGIDEDYYFGYFDRKQDRTKQFLRSKKKRCRTHKKECKASIDTVEQSDQLPPNSNEPQHAFHALLNKIPPATQTTQAKDILNRIGYYGYIFNSIHRNKYKKHKEDENVSGQNWVGPDLDLFYGKKTDKSFLLRSGEDFSMARKTKKHPKKRLSFKIPKEKFDRNRIYLHNLNKTFNSDSPHNNHRSKRPMLLLTGRLNKIQNRNLKRNDMNEKDKSALKYYLIEQASSEDESKLKRNFKTYIPKLFKEYDERERRKKIERFGENDDSDYDNSDPGSVSSGEEDSLKTLNTDIVKQIMDMTYGSEDKKLQFRVMSAFRNMSKLYYPAKHPKKYNFVLPDQFKSQEYLETLRSNSKLEAYIEVMKDMIQTDSTALKNYNWLATTVDIRSAFAKLLQLSDHLSRNSNDIHPKDLQLIKYILYLYGSTKDLFEEYEENAIVSAEESTEQPSNLRFTYTEKESPEIPKNLRFPVKNKEHNAQSKHRRGNHISTRRQEGRPWLKKDGLKKNIEDFNNFLMDLENVLNDLHDAIKHIAMVTKYRSQNWFENLKDLYLAPSRKKSLEIILHLEIARMIGLIEESAANGMVKNYVRYGVNNALQVERTKEEFAFVVALYLELKKLQ